MLLIYPPVAKPSEPPAGIAKLSGALSANGVKHDVLDANLEGIYYLLNNAPEPCDTWTRRAFRNLSGNINALKSFDTYNNIDRYKHAVMDINRMLERSAAKNRVRASLADYHHKDLSPVKSIDLIYAAGHPEEDPYYPYFAMRLSGLIKKEGIRFAGFSLNYLSQALTAFAMIGFLKREHPHVSVMLGGGLTTSWMSNPGWKNPFGGLIDHLVAGPGEIPLLKILGNKGLKKPDYIPAYELLPVKDYLSPGLVLPYSTSAGCYWGKCSFCPEKAEGNKYVQIEPDYVVESLLCLKDQFKPALIHLTDNAISPMMMRKMADTPLHTPWYGFARITRQLADPDFCMRLKNSGCVMLKLGIESGNQGVLDYMNKGCDLKTASSALETLHKAGIATYAYLLFGTPMETIQEARDTLNFAARHSRFIDFLNLAIFNLPVNSPETKTVDTINFYEGDLSLYTDFKHPGGWGRRQVRQLLEKEFRRHPEIQSIMRNHPPLFTSSHAPFFSPYFS